VTTTASPILELTALNAHYGDFQALFDVQMTIGTQENNGGHEVVAIIGANGAGKTTLLQSIAGLLQNQHEQIKYKGQDIGALRADQVAKLGIALVPEGRQLFPSLSVEENLKIGATIGRKGQWNLDSVYQLFPVLKERRHQASTQLSGGQQQMVAIGRALMANPELILFDEISLGLAPVIINSIYQALPEIVGSETTAVIVEQDVNRAMSVSSRIYCLQEGQVKLQGNSDQLTRAQITEAYFGTSVGNGDGANGKAQSSPGYPTNATNTSNTVGGNTT